MSMSLLTTKIVYQAVVDSSADPDLFPSSTDEEDIVSRPVWATSLSCSNDFLDGTCPLDESIIRSMNYFDKPLDDMHLCSYFLLDLEIIEQDDLRYTLSEIVGHTIVPLDTHTIYAEGNMAIISLTIYIDISRTPSKVKSINISTDCLV
jgi:hypothetical protein